MSLQQKIQTKNTFTTILFKLQAHLGESDKNIQSTNFYYIYGKRNNIAIWDLEKTIPIIKQIVLLIKNAISNKQTILFIGEPNNKILNNMITKTAVKINQPYITSKWISGFFTNWENIYKSLRNLDVTNQKKIIKQNKLLSLITLKQKPDFIFITNTKNNQSIINEANKINIPVIAFVDTDCDAINITYPIYLNDDSFPLLKFVLKLLEKN